MKLHSFDFEGLFSYLKGQGDSRFYGINIQL